jgi:membrane-associated phospholipid phosphatase
MSKTVLEAAPDTQAPLLGEVGVSSVPRGSRLRPVDWFTVVYLGITLIPILVFTNRNAEMLQLAGLHVAGIMALVAARKYELDRHRVGNWVLAFYPVILSAFLYTEIGPVVQAMHGGVLYDHVIQRAEVFFFGGQPAQDLHIRVGSRALGEYLHLGYVTYYLLAPGLLFTLWLTRPRVQFDKSIATISLSFYVSFLIFFVYPVAGPYQVLMAPDVESVGYVLPKLTRWLLDRGSSVGAAFPSSHVAVAVVVWAMAMRYHRGVAVLYAFLVPALAIGAIFGGYHYAVDIVAGVVLGVLIGTAGFGLTKVVARRVS